MYLFRDGIELKFASKDFPALHAVKSLKTDTRYNDKIRYNDNLRGTKPSLKR